MKPNKLDFSLQFPLRSKLWKHSFQRKCWKQKGGLLTPFLPLPLPMPSGHKFWFEALRAPYTFLPTIVTIPIANPLLQPDSHRRQGSLAKRCKGESPWGGGIDWRMNSWEDSDMLTLTGRGELRLCNSLEERRKAKVTAPGEGMGVGGWVGGGGQKIWATMQLSGPLSVRVKS